MSDFGLLRSSPVTIRAWWYYAFWWRLYWPHAGPVYLKGRGWEA
jgi:hypothetical protein